MTPKEKWERIKNPKCAKDYGLSIGRSELMTFPEGRALCAEIDYIREGGKDVPITSLDAQLKLLGEQMAETLKELCIKVIKDI